MIKYEKMFADFLKVAGNPKKALKVFYAPVEFGVGISFDSCAVYFLHKVVNPFNFEATWFGGLRKIDNAERLFSNGAGDLNRIELTAERVIYEKKTLAFFKAENGEKIAVNTEYLKYFDDGLVYYGANKKTPVRVYLDEAHAINNEPLAIICPVNYL